MQIDRRTFLGLTTGACASWSFPTVAGTTTDTALNGEPFEFPYFDQSQIPPAYRRQLVRYQSDETIGTIIVDTTDRFLYVTRERGMALRYGIGIGRTGFTWGGRATIRRKKAWPKWTPPAEMREREPDLPISMPGGPDNPLGARALYLFEGNRDTLYRLHGTSELNTIGQAVSSGCVRLLNQDIIDLYQRIPVGTVVVVLQDPNANQEYSNSTEYPPQNTSPAQDPVSTQELDAPQGSNPSLSVPPGLGNYDAG